MNKSKKIATGGIIAALYIVLTFFAETVGLASGAIQVRFSESLTLLPCLTSAAIPGLTVGCFLANFLTGCAFWDIIFGTLATFLGAVGTYFLRDKKIFAWIPPVLSNSIIVPIILVEVYGVEDFFYLIALQIFTGEVISCGILGSIVLKISEKHKIF